MTVTNFHQDIEQRLRRELDAPMALPDKLNNALRLLSKYRSAVIQISLIEERGTVVQGGPFQGMAFADRSVEGCHVPKLLGCYESELHPHILAAAERGYDAVINIGASEGYYAIGLARLMPNAQIYAYDTNTAAHAVCRELAVRNNVSHRVTIGSIFEGDDFERFADQRTLVFCDIEGGEAELLDPQRYPALRSMDIIVELHDGPRATPSVLIPQRFRDTHSVKMVPHGAGTMELPALFDSVSHLDQLLATWEWRAGPTPWAVLQAHGHVTAS